MDTHIHFYRYIRIYRKNKYISLSAVVLACVGENFATVGIDVSIIARLSVGVWVWVCPMHLYTCLCFAVLPATHWGLVSLFPLAGPSHSCDGACRRRLGHIGALFGQTRPMSLFCFWWAHLLLFLSPPPFTQPCCVDPLHNSWFIQGLSPGCCSDGVDVVFTLDRCNWLILKIKLWVLWLELLTNKIVASPKNRSDQKCFRVYYTLNQ